MMSAPVCRKREMSCVGVDAVPEIRRRGGGYVNGWGAEARSSAAGEDSEEGWLERKRENTE